MLNPKLERAWKWAFSSPGMIQQNERELRTFSERCCSELHPKLTAEIGTWNGVNAVLLSLMTSEATVSVDVHDYSGKDDSLRMACELDACLLFLTMDARTEAAKRAVVEFLDGQIDCLFIDDGHEFETIQTELDIYGPLVRQGGWIVFHDINFSANQCSPGKHPTHMRAPYHWQQLHGNKFEIVENDGPGIGVLIK